MALTQLAILYGVIGLGCALAVLARPTRRVGDAVIVLGLWPLFGPFLFLLPRRPDTVEGSGLAGLLPTPASTERLAARLDSARTRLDEIDALLARPELGLADVEARIDELSRRGASARALCSAESRRKSICGLLRRRKVLAQELEDLAELFLQLKTQSEVVRLAGAQADDGDSVSELVADIQSRLEGLDELMQEDM